MGSHNERWIGVDRDEQVHARVFGAGNSRPEAERLAGAVLPELRGRLAALRWAEATNQQRHEAKQAYTITPATAAAVEKPQTAAERLQRHFRRRAHAAGGGR